MNAAEAVALILLLAMIYDGYRAGFVKTFFSIIKISIAVVIGVLLSNEIVGKISEPFKNIAPGAFIVIFGLVFGILGALERLLNLIDKIPVAKQINRLAGLVAGVAKGLITIWTVFWLLSYFSDSEWVMKVNTLIMESEMLQYINEYNPIELLIKKPN